jgi:disulfide bond formation protein DsbB
VISKYALYFAWLIAIVATLGSLYADFIFHFVPCPLCWYQRIAMFPLAIILGIACYHNDKKVYRYAIPLITLGIVVAAYQIVKPYLPSMHFGELCGPYQCNGDKKNLAMTLLPWLSLLAFIGIGFFIRLGRSSRTHPG